MEAVARTRDIVRAEEVIGVKVIDPANENIGKIYEIVLDKVSGQVNYVVLESGSILGLGGKFFAIPWNSIHYDTDEEAFRLNVDKQVLNDAPGFDKDNWPEFSDESCCQRITDYYAKF